METIPISDLQKNLRRVLTTVTHTGKPVGVTDRGKLLVEITPPKGPRDDSQGKGGETKRFSWLGCMSGSGEILGDIISPAESMETWEVLAA